ncbi:MAG: TetR/AcrR family transcriptional regulator [Oscillospiraceae bacterium]|nr:TetR/AcrR family transcriptional regulator [Oscillospiraceae bacterium]
MPPKAKYTREEIIEAALELAAEKGIKALTARELGAALGTSSRPIFTAFQNMEEVLSEVRKAALTRFEEYARKAEAFTPVYKALGLQMVRFATEQPKLYRLLFMTEKPEAKSFDDVFANLGDIAVLCIEVIQRDYELSYENARLLFKHNWIHTYAMGALIATGVCSFTENEIQDMLSREFVAMLMLIKSGKAESCTTVPEHKIEVGNESGS